LGKKRGVLFERDVLLHENLVDGVVRLVAKIYRILRIGRRPHTVHFAEPERASTTRYGTVTLV
jgi:hypothetical protein